MTFKEFVADYGLKRSEGVVLRYLSDAYKALLQNVPDAAKDDEVTDVIEWLGATVRVVDSSLIDEWERLRSPSPSALPAESPAVAATNVTTNERAFRVMVRNAAFAWIQRLARGDYRAKWEADAMAQYWDEHDEIVTDAHARGGEFFDYAGDRIVQTIVDPEGWHEWVAVGTVDLDASRQEGGAVIVLEDIERR